MRAVLGRSIERWLYGRFIYGSAVHLLGEGTLFRRLRELSASQWHASEEIARVQQRRLAAVLEYARSEVPYYRRAWPRSLDVTPVNASEALRSLPFITKGDLQEQSACLRAKEFRGRVSRKTTGGSTGQAVTVIKDRRATAYERASMWLGYGWFGVQMGDRCVRFWGAPFATRRRWLTSLSDLVMHRIRCSAFAFTEDDLERYWQACVRFRPTYLNGYVSMLETFARFLVSRGYDGRNLGLRSIVATAEVLSPPQRNLLQSAFGAPVQVEYGCGEVGPIAYECEAGSLHLMTHDLVVEILRLDGKPAGVGETGEVVITDLNNRAMPLIRLRMGDFGVPGEACACGRGLPVLQKIWGRAYDFVSDPEGRLYHGEFFMYLFEDLRVGGVQIHAFQVRQDGPDSLDVAIVAPEPTATTQVAALLHDRLPSLRANVRRVAEIHRAPSGKMQVIVNPSARAALVSNP